MKAIRIHQYGGPEVMRLEEMPDPTPGAGQVVVRVHAAGLNPVDAYIRTGTHARKPPLPYTPGSDAGGVIESVGAGVSKWKPGDRVYVFKAADPSGGTYALRVLCNENHVISLVPHLTFQQGAAIGVPYATAYRALFDRAQTNPGEIVLVHGATGGVGNAAVQLAIANDNVVIGTGGTDQGRELVAKLGAQHVLDHKSAEYTAQIMKITNDKGVNVIIEMLANVNLAKDLTMLAHGGRVVVVGNRGSIEINPREIMQRESAILGMSLFVSGEEAVLRAHRAMANGFENRKLNPVIGKELPLSEAAKAHEIILKEPAYGKIVLIP